MARPCRGMPSRLATIPIAMVSCVLAVFLMITGSQPAWADRFILENGKVIEGTIIRATKSSIAIKKAIGSLQLVRLSSIEEFQVDRPNKSPVVGRLIRWTDGVYVVDIGDKTVELRDGVVLSEVPSRPIDTATAEGVAPAPDTDRSRSSPPKNADDDRALAATLDSDARAGKTKSDPAVLPASRAPGSQAEFTPAVVTPSKVAMAVDALPHPEGGVMINVSAASASEGESITFDLRLSQPLLRPLVIAYATIGGTAKDGADFETQRGIVTFEPGETAAVVRTALVDDDAVEGEEQFGLFLSADPALATLSERQVTAIIIDND